MTTTAEPRAQDEGLVLRGVSLRYGGVAALRDVDLDVPRGSVVALLGANGAGKSSLLRAVSGNVRPHRARVSGSIRWAGRDLAGRDPALTVRAGVGQVPEGRRVFARMTVHDNLLAGRVRGRTGRGAIDEVYERFPVLAERRRQAAGLLSGGEQQQLAIGRALVGRPDLLMLDEPSLGLAPKMVGRIAETVRAINATGTTVLLIEQNAAMAIDLATRVAVLELGRVALTGATDDPDLLRSVRGLYFGDDPTPSGAAPVAAPRPPLARWTDDRSSG